MSKKDKKLEMEINRPVETAFRFVTDPDKTHLWIDGLAREETNESPTRKGTIYRPYGEGDVPLGEFEVAEFENNKSFTFHKLGTQFYTRYTFTPTKDGGTHLEYYAWADDGDLTAASRFTPEVLAKLKAQIERA